MKNKPQITFSPDTVESIKASAKAIDDLGTKLGQLSVTAQRQLVDAIVEMIKKC